MDTSKTLCSAGYQSTIDASVLEDTPNELRSKQHTYSHKCF